MASIAGGRLRLLGARPGPIALAAAHPVPPRRVRPPTITTHLRQRLPHCPASPGAQPYAPQPAEQQGRGSSADADGSLGFKRSLWAFIDVVAIFGSVGGAVAALLGIGPASYVLALPILLPVVSLVAALNREGLIQEGNRQQYDKLSSFLQTDSQALLSDAKTAIDEVRRELRSQAAAASRLSSIESRLSSLEGSILSAGRSAREAASGLSAVPAMLQREQREQNEAVVAAMRGELKRMREAWNSEESAALARLDTRLAAVEGCLSGLEVAQGENIRRLSMSLNSALADAEATLQVSVRNEVAQCMEPVRRLPQMLATVLPTLALQSMDQGAGDTAPKREVSMPSEAVLQAAVRLAVSEEVAAAVQQILQAQSESFARVAEVRPTPLAEEQWDALGRRLSRLERLVEAVPEAAEVALRTQLEQQLPPALASTAETIGAQVTETAAREAGRTRGDVEAAQVKASNDMRSGLEEVLMLLLPLKNAVQGLQDRIQAQQDAQAEGAPAAAAQQEAAALGSQPAAAALESVSGQLAAVVSAVQQLDSKLEAVRLQQEQQQQREKREEAMGRGEADGREERAAEAARGAEAAVARQGEVLEGMKVGLEAMQEALKGIEARLTAGTAPREEGGRQAGDSGVRGEAGVAGGGEQGEERGGVGATLAGGSALVAPAGGAEPSSSNGSSGRSRGGAGEQAAAAASHEHGAAAAESREEMAEGRAAREAGEAGAAAAAVAAAAPLQAGNEVQQWGLPSDARTGGTNASPDAAAQQAAVQQPAVQPTAAQQPMVQQEPAVPSTLPQPQQQQQQPSSQIAFDRQYEQPQALQQQYTQQYTEPSPASLTAAAAHEPQNQEAWSPMPLEPPRSMVAAPPESSYLGDYVPRDVRGLPLSDVVSEGLRLLRLGREEARKGQDLGLADKAIDGAVTVFREALQLAPEDPKALGNLGNALLAQGELKRAYLDALMSGPAPATVQELEVQRSAETSIRAEASALLTRSGEMFKRVLELEGWSSRALVNWGRAMCLRAELADTADLASQLYTSALDKFEAVLEEDGGMVTAKYRAALAMRGLAKCRAGRPRDAAILLSDAANYLRDVVAASGPDAAALQGPAAEALALSEGELRSIAAGGATASGGQQGQAEGAWWKQEGGLGLGGGLQGGGGVQAGARALFGWAEQLGQRR